MDRLRRASDLLEAGEYTAADAILRGLLAEPDFASAAEQYKFAAYSLAAGASLYLENSDRAGELLDLALASPAANAQIASAALQLHLELWQPRRAIPAIRILAAQAPQEVRDLGTRTLMQMNAEFSRQDVPHAEQIAFLRSLFDANVLVEDGRQPSNLWRLLAELYVAEGNSEAAALVAQRITGQNDLVALQVDRRFDGIVARMTPDQLDVNAALERETAIIRSAIAREPGTLQHVVELTYAQLDAGRYQELLDTCDAVLARAAAATEDAPAFDDGDHALLWIHDNRARALLGLGRVDAAVAVFEAARLMQENGGSNTSQAINIAALYAALDRPRDALVALSGVKDASPYGWMQFHLARTKALRATPDDPMLRESIDYLREHRRDAPGALLEALLRLGRFDEASTVFRDRLNDPDQRNGALIAAQRFLNDPISPTSSAWIAQEAAFYARPEIVSAIEAVGRMVPVPLHQQVW